MDPKIFDILQKIAATFALFVGGGWVLMNYIRNRTHIRRLQVSIEGEIVERGSRRYLLATIQVRNPGLSKIKLPKPTEEGGGPHGSALLISTLADRADVPDLVDSTWQDVRAFSVLVHHTSIEPGLAINEQRLVLLPSQDYHAYRLRLRVLAHDQSWSATAIATSSPNPASGERLPECGE